MLATLMLECGNVGMWEYYRGKRNNKKNIAAHFSISIDIIREDNNYSNLIEMLEKKYALFLDGKNGLNKKTRSHYTDYSDDELESWLVASPIFENIKINKTDYTSWYTFGEISGRHLKYFSYPIDSTHFLIIRFKYYFTAKSDNELKELETIIPNDIEKVMNQIKISKL